MARPTRQTPYTVRRHARRLMHLGRAGPVRRLVSDGLTSLASLRSFGEGNGGGSSLRSSVTDSTAYLIKSYSLSENVDKYGDDNLVCSGSGGTFLYDRRNSAS